MTKSNDQTILQIEPVGPFYANVLAEIHQAGFDDAWGEAVIAKLLQTKGTTGLLARLADDAVGMALFWQTGDEAEILTLAVLPQARRQKVAQALIEHAVNILTSSGGTRLILEVATDNRAARGLYAKLGFKSVGRRPGYYKREAMPSLAGQRIDGEILALDLADGSAK